MALTPSVMVDLGTKAVDFELLNVSSGKKVSIFQFRKSRGLLVMFICRHCPYVKHLEKALAILGRDYEKSEIGIIAVSSNDAENYPDDHPSQLKKMVQELSFSFPFLYDEDQEMAKRYRAACTPDFFLFDTQVRLAYRGQFDDSRPGNSISVTGQDLRTAMDMLLAGRPPLVEQKPSMGCNIKWKLGSAPGYFN